MSRFDPAFFYENRLIKARRKSDNELIAEYKYDPSGRRNQKIVHIPAEQTINYIYDREHVIEERDGDNNVIVQYTYGDRLDEILTMKRVGNVYYYNYDRLGSVVNLSDSNGNLVESYLFDVFGKADNYGSVANQYFFTGRRYDSESGLIYYRTRYYTPTLGRFLSPDIIGYRGGLNLYCYVGNNTVNEIDPMGLFSKQKPGCDVIRDYIETPCMRACCDRHDKCYFDYQCNVDSWFPWCEGGQSYIMCKLCNIDVAICIINCFKPGLPWPHPSRPIPLPWPIPPIWDPL